MLSKNNSVLQDYEWSHSTVSSRSDSNATSTPIWTSCYKWSVQISLEKPKIPTLSYPDSVQNWNNLGPEIREIESISHFKNTILKTIKPQKRSIFKLHDPSGVKYLYQLRVGLSPLRHHKKRHRFIDTPNDTCRCGKGIETTDHFLLECSLFKIHRARLLSVINPITSKLYPWDSVTNSVRSDLLLYGDEKLNPTENLSILRATINYIQDTERFTWLKYFWIHTTGTTPPPCARVSVSFFPF